MATDSARSCLGLNRASQDRAGSFVARSFPERRVGASLRSWDLPDSVMC
jgi:hypothetical protein